MATYRTLLRDVELRAVLGADICSMLAMVVGDIALTVLVYQRTSSPFLAASTFAIAFVPMGVGAVLLGGVGRTRPSRDVLVLCEITAATLVGVMTLPGLPVAALLALLTVKGAVDPIFRGTRAATLPEIVGDEGFPLARSLLRLVGQNMQLVGFAVGGALLAFVSAGQALTAAALGYAASAAILVLGTRRRAPGAGAVAIRPLLDLRRLLTTPGMGPVVLLMWLPGFFAVGPEAVANPYAASIGGGAIAVGLLLSGLPIGSVIGEVIVGSRVPPALRTRLVVPLAAGGFLPPLFFVFGPPLPVAIGLLVLAGLGAYFIGLDQIVLTLVPENRRRQAFTLLGGGAMVTQGLGFAAAGATAQWWAPAVVIPVFAGVGLIVVLVVGRRLRTVAPAERGVRALPPR